MPAQVWMKIGASATGSREVQIVNPAAFDDVELQNAPLNVCMIFGKLRQVHSSAVARTDHRVPVGQSDTPVVLVHSTDLHSAFMCLLMLCPCHVFVASPACSTI